MRKHLLILLTATALAVTVGCGTSYKVKPLPFKSPASFENMVTLDGAQIASRSYTDPAETREVFGFDIIGAGMLPVQVVFDNQGVHSLEIDGTQSFIEDAEGNLWPVLSRDIAYERATKYAETKQIFKEGAYKGFLGAVAGSLIGGAVGIVTGDDVAAAIGKGAAVGAAAGATLGGVGGAASNDAQRAITNDLRDKSLENKAVAPQSLAHGFLFFPAEAKTAGSLRLRILEKESGAAHVLKMMFH